MDRLDATSPGVVGPAGPGGGSAGGGAELPALRGVSAALGSQCWLNTIVALTHMGEFERVCVTEERGQDAVCFSDTGAPFVLT